MPNAILWCRTFGSHFALLEYPDELALQLEKFFMPKDDENDDTFSLAFAKVAKEEAKLALKATKGRGRSKSSERKVKK